MLYYTDHTYYYMCVYDTHRMYTTYTIISTDELISCINQDIALSIKYLSKSTVSSQYSEVDQLTALISHTNSTCNTANV